MVFDAHNRAFAFFKGSCTRGIYDNMKTAVETVFIGKDRQFNRRFLRMCGHYLVEPTACTPASGWEKGQVENQVGVVRERFFTPRLRVASYEELNAWLLDRCVAEVMATGLKRRHEPPRIVGDLLSAEIAEKRARSIKYQLTIAKLPLAKDIDDFDFTSTPVNEARVRDQASGGFLAEQRNAVLIGGTGTGKSHLAIAISRACIRGGPRGRFLYRCRFRQPTGERGPQWSPRPSG